MKQLATHISFMQAKQMGPPPEGNLAIPVFVNDEMQTELYMPKGIDPQTPHDRDEIYFFHSGSGDFYNGKENVHVEAGAFIFVPAGVAHRFSNFSNDFTVWVVFYGSKKVAS